MKRKLMVTVVLVAVMIGGETCVVLAEHGAGGGCGGPPPGMEIGPGGFGGRMAKLLKLTDAQQSRIKAVFDAQSEEVAPLFARMHESGKLLMQAAELTVFDEVSVRTGAMAQARIEAELTVSRIRAQTRINALLTAEQREMLKLLRPDMERLPHKGE